MPMRSFFTRPALENGDLAGKPDALSQTPNPEARLVGKLLET